VPGTQLIPTAPVRKQGTALGDRRIVMTAGKDTTSDRLSAEPMMGGPVVRSMQPVTYPQLVPILTFWHRNFTFKF
jgi:hypothetical protein